MNIRSKKQEAIIEAMRQVEKAREAWEQAFNVGGEALDEHPSRNPGESEGREQSLKGMFGWLGKLLGGKRRASTETKKRQEAIDRAIRQDKEAWAALEEAREAAGEALDEYFESISPDVRTSQPIFLGYVAAAKQGDWEFAYRLADCAGDHCSEEEERRWFALAHFAQRMTGEPEPRRFERFGSLSRLVKR